MSIPVSRLHSPAVSDSTGERPTTPAPAQRAPRQERGRRRVDEILDAAEALFVETGPAATSIQDIARRAGASMGSMYHFFPTKESLLEGLRVRHREEARQTLAAMRDAIEGAEGLPLRAFVDRMLAPLAEL